MKKTMTAQELWERLERIPALERRDLQVVVCCGHTGRGRSVEQIVVEDRRHLGEELRIYAAASPDR